MQMPRHRLRQVIEDHEMGFFDYQVGKQHGLLAGILFARSHTQGDVQLLAQIGL